MVQKPTTVVAVVIFLATAACSKGSAEHAAPSPSPAFTSHASSASPTVNPLAWTTVLNDDFSDSSTGWPKESVEAGTAAYQSGSYVLTFKRPGTLGGANRKSADLGSLHDQRVAVDVQATGAGVRDIAGVTCRQQSSDVGYLAEMSLVTGYYWIYRSWINSQGDYKTVLLASGPAGDAFDQSAGATNRMQLTCTGGADGGPVLLTFGTNNKQLRVFHDADNPITSGPPGIIASEAQPHGGMTVSFDNLVVEKPAVDIAPSSSPASPIAGGLTPTKQWTGHGVRLAYPATWSVEPASGPSTQTQVWRTDFVAPSGAKLSISLDRNDDGSIWTRTEIDHIVRQQAELSRLGLQGPTDQFFAGRSAIEYGLTDPIGPVYDNLVFFPGSADLYTGDCKFSREQLVAFRDACARVIESLHLPPPPTQSPLPA